MKIDWNRKYTTISVYTFLVICASLVFFEIISKIEVFSVKVSESVAILQPFIVGFVIAYLLNFILKFYEDKILNKHMKNAKKKLIRSLGIILTYITAGALLYVFLLFVVPQLVQSIEGLANELPKHVTNVTRLVENLLAQFNFDNNYSNIINDKLKDVMNFTVKLLTGTLPVLGTFLASIASALWNLILGTVISIYLLIEKEKFIALGKKLTFSLFNKRHADKLLELSARTRDTFGNFIGGKILDSLIIGILTFVILTIFKMPYTLLVSVIVGITNIIPFFGPFIGAVPSAIIILFVSPTQALWFLLIIVIIQQLDGNVIGPKILGDSIGISAFWILFSILVAGKFFGFAGMVVGVPLFAIIYSIIKEIAESSLDKKGLPKDTDEYMK